MIKETKVKKSRTDLTRQLFDMKMDTKIGFWNVRTVWKTGKLRQIEEELATYKLQMTGLSKTRWNGFGEHITGKGNSLIYSGKGEEEQRSEGVGILLTRPARKSFMEWQPISSRIIYARFRTKIRNISIIQFNSIYFIHGSLYMIWDKSMLCPNRTGRTKN
jgi:hypothetical protein